jgi:hypothetical protein
LPTTSSPPRRSAEPGFSNFWTPVTRPLVGVASPRAAAESAWAVPRSEDAVVHSESAGYLSASACQAVLPLANSMLTRHGTLTPGVPPERQPKATCGGHFTVRSSLRALHDVAGRPSSKPWRSAVSVTLSTFAGG